MKFCVAKRIYATLYHAQIICEQDAANIVKNISTDGEVISKIKVAYFFLGHSIYVRFKF